MALSPFAGDSTEAGVATLLGKKEMGSSGFLPPKFSLALADLGCVIKSRVPAQGRELQQLQITAGSKNLGVKLSLCAGLQEFRELKVCGELKSKGEGEFYFFLIYKFAARALDLH